MRYKAMFAAGLAVGFVAGARAGRERYDQLVKLSRQVAGSPAVQKSTQAVTAKSAELARTASAKAPDIAKTATAKVPKIVGAAKQQASSHLPFGGKGTGDPEAPAEEAADSAEGGTAAYNGVRAD
jgi:hypothetical protein